MRRRELLSGVGTVMVCGIAGCSGESTQPPPAFKTGSPALEQGGELPVQFTCDGEGKSPPFTVDRVPEPTASLALTGELHAGFANESVFWTLWNVPPDTERIPSNIPREPSVQSLNGARQGKQKGGKVGYEAPCPPREQSYEYRFQLYALDEELDLEGAATNDSAMDAIGNSVLASNRITVKYTRSGTDSSTEGAVTPDRPR